MSDDYENGIAARLRGPVRHRVTVMARPHEGTPFPLAAEGVEVTFSEDWAPYIQASLTAAVPESQARLDELDPRARCRVSIDVGYTFPDGWTEDYPAINLGLRSRQVNRPGNTLALTAAGDEARAQDNRVAYYFPVTRAGVKETTQALLDYALHPQTADLASDFGPGYSPLDLADLDVQVGDDLWTAVYEVASRTGTRIYCNETGTWRITDYPDTAGEPRYALKVGQAGTLLESSTGLDREDWFNAVCLRFKWTDPGDGLEKEVLGNAAISSGPFRVLDVGRKVHFEDYQDRAIGVATARKIAASRLKNLVTRGRSLTLTATAAYWLRPGMTITVTLPTGDTEAHLIQSITFTPAAGRMSITTRQPLDVQITTGE